MQYWERRLRLGTGLVLAVYVVQHFLNHSLGIVGPEAMETWRRFWSPIWDFAPLTVLLHGSLLTHFLLALYRLYKRRTLRLPRWEWLQLGFGLSVPPLIAAHVIGTRVAAEYAGFEPDYYYVASVVAANPRTSVQMPLLMVVVWTHVCIGLHFWLRLKDWYRATLPVWVFLAIGIPLLAGAGILRTVLSAREWLADRDLMADIFYNYQAMDAADRAVLSSLETPVLRVLAGMLLAVLLARWVRARLVARRASVRIRHSGGRLIAAQRGHTILESVRAAGVPHASVCGGRGRCTTCRVRVGEGREALPAPSALERDALARIGADPNVRLACQARPVEDVAITPLVGADCGTAAALAVRGVQGTERHVVCMFVDMRGSTRIGERILPYDVVFILNQFFGELSDALDASGGHYAQFSGDGLMALYGLDDPRPGAGVRGAISGAAQMFRRLERLNERVRAEFGIEIRMGVGIHAGAAIVGHMGPPRAPLLTAIGDNINIAARLESATKTEDCDLIVSVEALSQLGDAAAGVEQRVLSIRGREAGIAVAAFDAARLVETFPWAASGAGGGEGVRGARLSPRSGA